MTGARHIAIGMLFTLELWTMSLAAQPLAELRAMKLTTVDSRVLFTGDSIAAAMDYLASIGVMPVS